MNEKLMLQNLIKVQQIIQTCPKLQDIEESLDTEKQFKL